MVYKENILYSAKYGLEIFLLKNVMVFSFPTIYLDYIPLNKKNLAYIVNLKLCLHFALLFFKSVIALQCGASFALILISLIFSDFILLK